MFSMLSTTLPQLFPPKPVFTDAAIPSQAGKVFIVTGGNAGLGFHLVKILYEKGARVYMLTRSETKAKAAIDTIKSESEPTVAGGDIKFIHLDLSDLTTIKPAVEEFESQESKLDVLWNNAGVAAMPVGSRTKQGHELTMGTNCLGPYLLTQLLLPYLKAAAKTAPPNSVRIIFTASPIIETNAPKGGIIISELTFPGSDQILPYAMSKAGNWFLADKFATVVGKDGIVSLAQNPGNMKTGIWDTAPWFVRMIMSVTMWPALYGAYTSLWAGLNDGITVEDGGRYIVPWGKWHPTPKEDMLAAMKSVDEGGTGEAGEFWSWCEEQSRDFA